MGLEGRRGSEVLGRSAPNFSRTFLGVGQMNGSLARLLQVDTEGQWQRERSQQMPSVDLLISKGFGLDFCEAPGPHRH